MESDSHTTPLPTSNTLISSAEIMKLLPHKYPFLLVDKITYLDKKSIVGIKNVTVNENFFQGHFSSMPIMPGVLQIESMAQTSGILIIKSSTELMNDLGFLSSIENCRFKKQIVPGDTLHIYCEMIREIRFGIAKIKCQIFSNSILMSMADLTLIIKPETKSNESFV